MFDILIKNCAVVSMDSARTVYPEAGIGVEGSRIVAIQPRLDGEARKVIDAEGCVAMPGLVNCHTHVYQSLIEGIGYDMHFDPWNWRYLFPIVSKLRPEDADISTRLAALEMIKSGTTTVSDHWYLHTDFANIRRVVRAFNEAGVRHHAVYGLLTESFAGESIGDDGMTMVKRGEALLSDARALVEEWHGRELTTVALGPATSDDVSEALMRRSVEVAAELDLGISTHAAGWAEIVSSSFKQYGMRDLEFMHHVGLTGPRAIIVHAVWLSNREINILAETGSKVAHCPVGNMHLGYGIAPVSQMLAGGVTVGLGTDGAASFTYDLFEVMKTAAMLQKAVEMDAEALTAEQALAMGTCDGARVLGLADVGALAPGRQADIIIVDLQQPHLMPVGRLASKLVYSARGSDVVTSIIGGQLVMEDRVVLTMDESQILADGQAAAKDLIARGGAETAAILDAPWPRGEASWRAAVHSPV